LFPQLGDLPGSAIDRKYGGIDRKYWTVFAEPFRLSLFGPRYRKVPHGNWDRKRNLYDQEEQMASDALSSIREVRGDEEDGILRKPVVSVDFIPERFLDTEEAAAIMKIHPKTLQKLARKGLVRGIHVGKLWRFRVSEIEEWAQRQMAS
jgi:excisionase family DNA binding protein